MRFFVILFFLVPLPAFAHWGHLPELAGHSHWIGMAGVRENSEEFSKDEEVSEETEEVSEETEEELQEA